jgi:RNA polymerase sigma-70 factor (ECF subfamily)
MDAATLVVRIADQDREAFKALFTGFAPRVKTYLLRHGATPAQADDLAQETLLTVWRKASYFDPRRASVAAWLFTIARNLRIDSLRRERATVAYDLDPPERPDDAAPADDELAAAERDTRVREALKILPPEQVEVIRLSFFQDKPHSEIAQDLELPLGTVKSRLRLAMARLKGVLGDVL